MQRITKDFVDRITLNASLQRLDIAELEERLEFSPLLVPGGQQPGADGGTLCCVCKAPDDLPDGVPDIRVANPGQDGMGTTGPTSGGVPR